MATKIFSQDQRIFILYLYNIKINTIVMLHTYYFVLTICLCEHLQSRLPQLSGIGKINLLWKFNIETKM